jgi:hypothetical protein
VQECESVETAKACVAATDIEREKAMLATIGLQAADLAFVSRWLVSSGPKA